MMTAAAWQAGGGHLGFAGQSVFFRRGGQGPPLLLIHGFPTSSWDWARVWPALTQSHDVIAFDLLGFGLSDKPRQGDYRITRQADLAEAVLAHCGITRCAILAHDYGDTVAQELLARHNEGGTRLVIARLVLLNGGLFPETHRPVPLQTLLSGPLGPLVARLSSYRRFAGNLRRICRRPLAEDELREHWRLLVRDDGLHILHRLIGYMRERREHRARWVGALQHASVPIRVVDGLDDPISGAHMVARYRELVPEADIVGLPGVGHYPQIEAPDEVLAAIGGFLDGRSVGAA